MPSIESRRKEVENRIVLEPFVRLRNVSEDALLGVYVDLLICEDGEADIYSEIREKAEREKDRKRDGSRVGQRNISDADCVSVASANFIIDRASTACAPNEIVEAFNSNLFSYEEMSGSALLLGNLTARASREAVSLAMAASDDGVFQGTGVMVNCDWRMELYGPDVVRSLLECLGPMTSARGGLFVTGGWTFDGTSSHSRIRINQMMSGWRVEGAPGVVMIPEVIEDYGVLGIFCGVLESSSALKVPKVRTTAAAMARRSPGMDLAGLLPDDAQAL